MDFEAWQLLIILRMIINLRDLFVLMQRFIKIGLKEGLLSPEKKAFAV